MTLDVRAKPKGDKRARTRAALVAAAGQVIAEKGYDQTSLDDVAARAGMTRGAIYGNFKDRDDLFVAVVQTHWTPIVAPLKPGATLREQMRFTGAFVAKEARERRRMAPMAAAFRLRMAGSEPLRARVAALNDEIFARLEASLAAAYPAGAFRMPVRHFVRAAYALTEGLVFAYFANPSAFPEEVFISAFEALAG